MLGELVDGADFGHFSILVSREARSAPEAPPHYDASARPSSSKQPSQP